MLVAELAGTIRDVVATRPGQTWLDVEAELIRRSPKSNRLWLAVGLSNAVQQKLVRLGDRGVLTLGKAGA